jgi:mono/diheme cytochrome c family protein
MPETDPSACSDDFDTCPRDTAAHILCAFNPDLAEGCSNAFSKAEVPPTANLTTGAAEYTANCAFCHGANGRGSAFYPGSLENCEVCKGTFEGLQNKIHFSMPPPTGASCVDDCAENTAAHILCQFNPDLAEGCSNASTKAEVPPTADLTAGASRFNSQCLGCHRFNLSNCIYCRETFDVLQNKIRDTMPRGNSGACIDPAPGVSDPSNCAENTAAHIFCVINPSLAEGCPSSP